MKSVQRVSSHVIWKIETFVEENIRNIVHRTMMPQSRSKEAPWDLTQFSQSPPSSLCHFPESHPWSEISSLSKMILVLGKSRGHRAPNLGCRGTESIEWFNASPKICTRHDAWEGVLLWWSCQSPVAHSCGLLNYPNSFFRGMFKVNAKFDADSFSTCSVILNTMATQYSCSLSGASPLTLTSTLKSSLFIHAHSSLFSLAAKLHWFWANCSHYINNGWIFSGQTPYS